MNPISQPGTYIIRIKGHLGRHRAAQFAPMTITLTDNGETRLSGLLADQAALHGLLRKVRDSGLELLSVNRLEKG